MMPIVDDSLLFSSHQPNISKRTTNRANAKKKMKQKKEKKTEYILKIMF
jgi:hypothetical protein